MSAQASLEECILARASSGLQCTGLTVPLLPFSIGPNAGLAVSACLAAFSESEELRNRDCSSRREVHDRASAPKGSPVCRGHISCAHHGPLAAKERVSSLLAQFDWEDATITKDPPLKAFWWNAWCGSQDRFLAIMDNEKAAEYLQEAGIDVVGHLSAPGSWIRPRFVQQVTPGRYSYAKRGVQTICRA